MEHRAGVQKKSFCTANGVMEATTCYATHAPPKKRSEESSALSIVPNEVWVLHIFARFLSAAEVSDVLHIPKRPLSLIVPSAGLKCAFRVQGVL